MNFKHVFAILMVFGMVFAFPSTISGTDLELTESEQDDGYGYSYAYYENSDLSLLAMVTATEMTASEWTDETEGASDYGITKGNDGTLEYYYMCESASYYGYGNGYVCNIAFYYSGKAYTVTAFEEGATQSGSLNLALKVGKEVAGVSPLGNLCPCPIGMLLVGITLAGASKVIV